MTRLTSHPMTSQMCAVVQFLLMVTPPDPADAHRRYPTTQKWIQRVQRTLVSRSHTRPPAFCSSGSYWACLRWAWPCAASHCSRPALALVLRRLRLWSLSSSLLAHPVPLRRQSDRGQRLPSLPIRGGLAFPKCIGTQPLAGGRKGPMRALVARGAAGILT